MFSFVQLSSLETKQWMIIIHKTMMFHYNVKMVFPTKFFVVVVAAFSTQ
jgi:hypothetical protein